MLHDRTSRRLGSLGLILLGLWLPFPAAAQDPAVPLAELSIGGDWEVTYADQNLGFVTGRGEINEEAESAEVTFVHPSTGEKFVLRSRRFSRAGETVTIEFEGESPSIHPDDGLH